MNNKKKLDLRVPKNNINAFTIFTAALLQIYMSKMIKAESCQVAIKPKKNQLNHIKFR
jgi:hypothetical protein